MGKMVRRRMAPSTGAGVGPGRASSQIEVVVPNEGRINIKKAENGVVVSVYDDTKEYNDPNHETMFVVNKVSDIVLK